MSNVLLGKRKRRDQIGDSSSERQPGQRQSGKKSSTKSGQPSDEELYRSLLQRHFEGTFEPIAVKTRNNLTPTDNNYEEDDDNTVDSASDVSAEDSDSEDDDAVSIDDQPGWDGFSEGSSNTEMDLNQVMGGRVEVVDHSKGTAHTDDADGSLSAARRSFMGSQLPSSQDTIRALRNVDKSTKKTGDSDTDAAQMANDAALQRLLRESKLLSSSTGSTGSLRSDSGGNSLHLTGKNRHRALDERLQSLGARASTLAQKSMPLVQRQGIARKSAERESTRRREAREAGVVLERERSGRSDVQGQPIAKKRRERGIGAPSVGKFRGGTLTLSAKDIRDLQGSRSSRSGSSRGSRGKARGRGGARRGRA